MRVLLVSCVYPPEPVVSAQTSCQIAEALIHQGHEVSVIASFPTRPAGQLFRGYAWKLFEHEQPQQQLEIVRCFSFPSTQSSMSSRFLENISFGLTSGWQALTLPRPDVIYANTWPIFATGLVWLVSKIRRIPLVLSIQDVYPDSLIAQKRVKQDSVIISILRWFDTFLVQHSRAAILISPRLKQLYAHDRGIPENQLFVVPNWNRMSDLSSDKTPRHIREQHNIPDTAFLVAYGGNVGMAAGVETVIGAFRHLADSSIYLLIAGDGSRVDVCRRLAAEVGPERILFHSPWPMEQTAAVYHAADVLILPTRGSQSAISVPSKLVGYMLSAKPVIALAQPGTDLADLIETSHCGWVVEPDNSKHLADRIKTARDLSSIELSEYGEAGRTYALNHLVSAICLPEVEKVLNFAVSKLRQDAIA